MEDINDLIHKLSDIEVLILRVTALGGIVVFCASMLWSHIKAVWARHRNNNDTEEN